MDALHCLGGKSAPAGLMADLCTWYLLSSEVRASFWEVLLPNLAPEVDDRITRVVQEFMKRHELTQEQLAPSVAALRLLFRGGAQHNVGVEQFVEDANTLVSEDDELSQSLTTWYSDALPLLRQEIVMSTVAEHGNLTCGMGWRVDMVTRSDRGKGVNTPVAVFTFRYLQGKDEKRITLQMLPEMLEQVKQACVEILD